MPTNAETEGRAFNPDSDGTSEEEGGNEEVQALTQVQPGQELGEDEAESGGEESALVSNGSAVRHNIVDDADGNVQSITFYRGARQPVIVTPPDAESDERLLWDLFLTMRRGAARKRELLTAINKARDVLVAVTGGVARARSASRSNSTRGGTTWTPRRPSRGSRGPFPTS